MKNVKITKIVAYHQFDSRGFPTVAVMATSETGKVAKAIVPSGASTGEKEAVELRDGDKSLFGGKSVFKAIDNVNKIIAKQVEGQNVFDQRGIDELMIKLDGTPNKGKLGANAILAVSLAVARLASMEAGKELYRYIAEDLQGNKSFKFTAPQIMVNIINGGKHANNMLDFQEFMLVPKSTSIYEQTRMASDTFHSLAKVLKGKKYPTGKGDEGGYDTAIQTVEEGFECLMQAVKDAGYNAGKDISFALDVAASEFCDNNKYTMKIDPNTHMGLNEMIDFYKKLVSTYPIMSIEDPLDEKDFDGFAKITETLKGVQIVGDDLYCTNKNLLQEGINHKSTNAILIKLNQIGSLSETLDTINLAKANKQNVVVSHRSGETEDTTIADLTIGVNAEFIKTGSFSRSERLCKYNRLLEIENIETKK